MAAGVLALATGAWVGGACAQSAPPQDSGTGPICADRPTKSSNACAVDAGRWQLETDLANGAFQRLGGVTTDVWLAPNPTLKYGLAKNLDVEANLALYESVRTRSASGTQTLEGIGDLYLRLKWAAWNSRDGNAQVGLFPYVKLPTARRGIGDRAVEAGLIAPVNIKLDAKWAIGFAPEADALSDASGSGRHLNTAQAVNVAYSLPHDWTLYGELWGDWNFDPAGTTRQASLDFAVSKLIGQDLQLDAGVNLGLNRTTPGANVYLGVSRRF